MTAHDIIRKPILSEKAYAGIKDKVYTFEVDKNSNKIEIRNAIEEIFGVKVARVNTSIVKGTKTSRNTRQSGRVYGKTSDYKKAVVFLKSDSKSIEFFDSLS